MLNQTVHDIVVSSVLFNSIVYCPLACCWEIACVGSQTKCSNLWSLNEPMSAHAYAMGSSCSVLEELGFDSVDVMKTLRVCGSVPAVLC